MLLRSYNDGDAAQCLVVFLRAIRETASRDYTPAQIAAWGSDDIDTLEWATARRSSRTHVAEVDHRVVGFTDVDDDGYIDMLYVDPAFGRQGVASRLLDLSIATAAGLAIAELRTHASITARPFFEARGFALVAECHPVVRGVSLTNFSLARALTSGQVPS